MIYISSLLPRQYQSETKALFVALAVHAVPYALLDGTNDIWLLPADFIQPEPANKFAHKS